MCTTCNCFKHKPNDIYYTAFTVILIKNMINKRNHTIWPQYVVSQCSSLRYSFTKLCPGLVGANSLTAVFDWNNVLAAYLRAKSRCQCCRSHCCSNSLKQYPYNFECIRLLLFYSVIFQSCKFSYPILIYVSCSGRYDVGQRRVNSLQHLCCVVALR